MTHIGLILDQNLQFLVIKKKKSHKNRIAEIFTKYDTDILSEIFQILCTFD